MNIESVLTECLRDRTRRLTHAEAHELAAYTSGGGQRTWWMPGRDWKPTRESMTDIMAKYNTVAHPEYPVSVRVMSKAGKGTEEVARYGSWAEYEAGRDPAYVPRGQPQVVEGVTVVLCAPKPWAGKTKPVEPTSLPKARRASDDGMADRIVAVAPGSRTDIQKRLEEAGLDKVMLDNSLGGRLDRLAREGRLIKAKDGKRVMYSLPGGK